jgi:peptidoglycan/LPS O-acetylase OafA/YrhL
MSRGHMVRLLVLAALLLSLIRVVITHSAHLGPGEWAVVVILAVALLTTLAVSLRRVT